MPAATAETLRVPSAIYVQLQRATAPATKLPTDNVAYEDKGSVCIQYYKAHESMHDKIESLTLQARDADFPSPSSEVRDLIHWLSGTLPQYIISLADVFASSRGGAALTLSTPSKFAQIEILNKGAAIILFQNGSTEPHIASVSLDRAELRAAAEEISQRFSE